MIKRIILMFVGVALMALPAMAQTFGTKQAEQPNAAFQSTSTMMGSGSSYSANPTLNSDGTASYNGAAASGPRKAKKDDDLFGGETVSGDPKDPQPLGDAVLPLLLMAFAWAMARMIRRKAVKG